MERPQTRETVSINIRAKARQRDLIDQAAGKLGRSRSNFMLDAACRKAEDILLDQAFFAVDAGVFASSRRWWIVPFPRQIACAV